MRCEWDPGKASSNFEKHSVEFADAAIALEDPLALTIPDSSFSSEDRFVSMGTDPMGRILVTVFAFRGEVLRIISSRKATRGERLQYEESQ